MTSRSLGHRAPLLWLLLPYGVGLVLGKAAGLAHPAAWLAGAAASCLGAVAAHRLAPRWLAPAVILSLLCAGVASYALRQPRLDSWASLPPREAEVTLRVDRLFASRLPGRASGLARITEAAGPAHELVGQSVFFTVPVRPPEAAPLRSTVLRVQGIIAPLPRDPPANSFDGYLANAGVNFRLSRARVREIVQPPNRYRRFCARAAIRLSGILGARVESKRPGLLGVYRAMLLGQQHELTDDQAALYRATGTMHVFSISGLHIAAIALGLHALLALLRLPVAVRYPAGLALLWLYVDVTGTAPSAVRAFVMVALIETSLVLRAPRNPVAALTASALAVLVTAPLQLFSASFQMSYGIVAALLLLGLPLASAWEERFPLFRDLPRLNWRWHHWARDWTWNKTLQAAAIGLAASLVSAITGITFFGLFTPGSFVANLWLIPSSMLVIYFGFVSLICGLAGFTAGAALANHAALVLLALIDLGVRWFAGLPAMWFEAAFRAPWLGAASLALLLAVLGLGYARHWDGWYRGYWTPFVVVALVLGLGVRYG